MKQLFEAELQVGFSLIIKSFGHTPTIFAQYRLELTGRGFYSRKRAHYKRVTPFHEWPCEQRGSGNLGLRRGVNKDCVVGCLC